MLVFFSISILSEHICILNARFGGEIDQQNVIMHMRIRPITRLNMKATGLIYNSKLQFKYTAAKYRLNKIPACANACACLVSKNLFACLHKLDSLFLLLRVQSSGLHIMRDFLVRQRLHFLVVFE